MKSVPKSFPCQNHPGLKNAVGKRILNLIFPGTKSEKIKLKYALIRNFPAWGRRRPMGVGLEGHAPSWPGFSRYRQRGRDRARPSTASGSSLLLVGRSLMRSLVTPVKYFFKKVFFPTSDFLYPLAAAAHQLAQHSVPAARQRLAQQLSSLAA